MAETTTPSSVTVRFTAHYGPYNPGEKASFTQDGASALYKRHVAMPCGRPKGEPGKSKTKKE